MPTSRLSGAQVSIPKPTLTFCLASSVRSGLRGLSSSWQPSFCRAGRGSTYLAFNSSSPRPHQLSRRRRPTSGVGLGSFGSAARV
eukprot:861074-Pyramimonas_sp.AAC.1